MNRSTSRCNGSKISGFQQTVVSNMAKKNWHVHCMTIIPVHYCTQEKNSSLDFSSIVRQCKWPFLSRTIVKIQTFFYHGNVTSHISIIYLPGAMQCAAVTTQSGTISDPPQLNTLEGRPVTKYKQ